MDLSRLSSTSTSAENNGMIHGMPVEEWRALSDEERAEYQRNRRREAAFKTAMCKIFREKGECPYGDGCRFAHDTRELRPPPNLHPKHKTVLCRNFSITGSCRYGARCQFIHRERDNSDSRLSPDRRNQFSQSLHARAVINSHNQTFQQRTPRANDNNNTSNEIHFSDSFAQMILHVSGQNVANAHFNDDNHFIEYGQSVLDQPFSKSCLN
uniref:C3H1-type domain-containing protein n=1 Tax=Panagrolaimus sp. PS1159 TaxID=55785 RepID=A0AC35G907_9BILA